MLPVHVGRLGWSFGIRAVRPNPVSGATTIGFELPWKGRVLLDLMDVGGRRVRRLVDAELDGGMHDVAFDPRRAGPKERPLPAGVYQVFLRFNGRVEGKRSIIVVP